MWTWNREKRSAATSSKNTLTVFLKIKTEASGWPKTCQPGKLCLHKTVFLQRFELNEGVKLDPDKISYNEGLRFNSKTLLNSFWGYLGMRENLPKTR